MNEIQNNTQPTEETVSVRWVTTLAAKLFCTVLGCLLAAELIRAFAIADMAATVEVCKTAAQQLLTAIIAVAAADRYTKNQTGGNVS